MVVALCQTKGSLKYEPSTRIKQLRSALSDEFKKGHSHLALIQKLLTSKEMDPCYETIGIVTLEDILEELIQSEIADEADVTADNHRRLSVFHHEQSHRNVSNHVLTTQTQSLFGPQLQLAAYQFLSATVPSFHPQLISPAVLHRLLGHRDSARLVRYRAGVKSPSCLFTAGQPADYFILILEGRIEVKAGTHKLVFQSGPFTYFGISALKLPNTTPSVRNSLGKYTQSDSIQMSTFTPDFTVYPVTNVLYLCITRSQYLAAYSASISERKEQRKEVGVRDHMFRELRSRSLRDFVDATAVPVSSLHKSLLLDSNLNVDQIGLFFDAASEGAENSSADDFSLGDHNLENADVSLICSESEH